MLQERATAEDLQHVAIQLAHAHTLTDTRNYIFIRRHGDLGIYNEYMAMGDHGRRGKWDSKTEETTDRAREGIVPD